VVSDEQLDLFAGSGGPGEQRTTPFTRPPATVPAELDDAALLAAIPASGLADGPALVAEAGHRQLAAAIPVLENYCRRFAGFGTRYALPEQAAAFAALAAIGGTAAAQSVARIIVRSWVQGPTLTVAVAAAARLGSRLPADLVVTLMRHHEPAVRADACRLVRSGGSPIETLIELLGDLHREVGIEAACALARLGRVEGRPLLKRELLLAPTPRVIEALVPIADDDCVVALGKIARSSPALAGAARDALASIEHELAGRILAGLAR
jgi:hypothetical protein